MEIKLLELIEINAKKKLDGKVDVLVQELVLFYRLREESVFEHKFKDKFDVWISS